MKTTLQATLALALLAAPASAGLGTWTPAGPPGGSIGSLAVAPSQPQTVYLAAGHGFYRSEDGGHSWQLGTWSDGVGAFAVDPTNAETIYAAWGDQAAFERSFDGGRSFESINFDLAVATHMVVDPLEPATLYAAGGAVVKSTDGGTSWSPIAQGLPDGSLFVQDFDLDPANPSRLFAVVDAFPAAGGAFTSADGGASWVAMAAPPGTIRELVVDTSQPATVVAAIATGTLWRSSDLGTTWRRVNRPSLPIEIRRLWSSPANPAVLYASDDRRLFRSTDGGASFVELSPPVFGPNHRLSLALHPTNPAVFYLGGLSGGLWKTVDGGTSFQLLDLRLDRTVGLDLNPGTPGEVLASVVGSFVIGAPNTSVQVSHEGGSSWSSLGVPPSIFAFGPITGAVAYGDPAGPSLFAGLESAIGVSTNGGANWFSTQLLCSRVEKIRVAPSDRNVVYAGGSLLAACNNLPDAKYNYRSDDGGLNWSAIEGMPEAVAAHDPHLVWAIRHAPGSFWGVEIQCSGDGGSTWQSASGDLPDVYPWTVAAHPTADGRLYAGTSDGVFTSSDGGEHWEQVFTVAGFDLDATHLALDPSDPLTVLAYIEGVGGGLESALGVYRATWVAGSWEVEPLGHPPGYRLTALAVDPFHPQQLYAATESGGLLAYTRPTASTCTASAERLCLNSGRFAVSSHWRDFEGGRGHGQALPLTDDTGTFWFFSAGNRELIVKALDGTSLNDFYWIFYGALSSVEYVLDVTDTATGETRTYFNPPRTLASRADTRAFYVAPPEAASQARSAANPSALRTAGAPKAPAATPASRLSPPSCIPTNTSLCIGGGFLDFRVEVSYSTPGLAGSGQAIPLDGDTGAFWFFDDENVELMIKVLDGRAVNGHYWVFYGALSNVEYMITVTNTADGTVKTYFNPTGTMASVADTEAF